MTQTPTSLPTDYRRRGAGALVTQRRWPRRVLIGVNTVVALCLIGAASAYGYAQWRLNQIHRERIASLAPIGGGKAFTVLIVGSDSRAALSGPNNSQFGGTSSVGGQRSDTVMLARVAPDAHQIMLMSIPRDLWVNIPGLGENRINAAFDSGPNLLVKTIETDLGIPINHYVEVNFDSFRDISNAVGGVRIYFPTPAKDSYSNLVVTSPGCFAVKGDLALAFVRARHWEYYQNGYWQYEAQSDLARIQRQQFFVRKLIKKAEGEFTNPIALNNVIAGITKNLTVDTKFSTNTMLAVAADFRAMNAAAIPSLTLPTYGYVTAGGADVLGLQQPQAAQTIAAFNKFGKTVPAPPKKTKKTTHATKHTSATAPPVTVSPAKVSIEVVNGTGTGGQAGEMTRTLVGLGYVHAAVAYNSPGSSHATTEVLYAPDSRVAAEQVAAGIPGGATTAVSSALTATPYNLEVVTGSSYGGGGSGTTTTSTTLPGTNPNTYELPGSTGPPPASCR